MAFTHDTDGWYGDFARPRVVLQPIAAVLGLFGFAGATFIVAANIAGWYGKRLDGLWALVAWLAGPRVAWPVTPLVTSIGFLLLAGIEMAFAGYHHDAGGV